MTREEAITRLKNMAWLYGSTEREQNIEAIDLAIEALSEPSIVRCKDCKFKSLDDDGDTKYYYCALEDRPNRNWSVDDTDYCSWGE